jgi:Tol biopolymer transport system component
MLSGTEGATYPFWSPDSRYIGFFTATKLIKLEANGGPPQTLCDTTSGRGGTWSTNGTIVFAANTLSALSRVDAAGGTPVPASTLPTTEASHRWPDFLPDGNHFIYFAHGVSKADDGIYLAALDSNNRKLLLHNSSSAIYAAPGFILFVRDNTLMAQKINLRKLEMDGEAKPLADHAAINADTWLSIVSASSNGELLYQHGSLNGGSQLISYDSSGKPGDPVLPDPAEYLWPTLSPDGSKLAFDIGINGVQDIWVMDLARRTKTRLSFGPLYSNYPIWWPDGKSLVYAYGANGNLNDILRQNADGTGGKEKLLETPGVFSIPGSVSPDGQYIAYSRLDPKSKTGRDIWILPTTGDQKPYPLIASEFTDVSPVFSPDGKWLAYNTDESGRFEIYIQPFPSGPGRWQVSTAGGIRASWRKDGKELFFMTPDSQQMMAVDIQPNGASLQLGTPHPLFKVNAVTGPLGPYTVSADGKKFIVNVVMSQSITEPPTLVTNWTADLKQ